MKNCESIVSLGTGGIFTLAGINLRAQGNPPQPDGVFLNLPEGANLGDALRKFAVDRSWLRVGAQIVPTSELPAPSLDHESCT